MFLCCNTNVMLICIDDFIICPFISLYFIVRPQAKVHSFNIPYMVWKPRKYITTSNTILYDPKTDTLHFYKITSFNLYSVLKLFQYYYFILYAISFANVHNRNHIDNISKWETFSSSKIICTASIFRWTMFYYLL